MFCRLICIEIQTGNLEQTKEVFRREQMSSNKLSNVMENEHLIASLLVRWGHARDSDDWETLSGCFQDDATIHISWISGPARDFVARSRAMSAERKPGTHNKHLITGPWILVNRNHAFSRCHVNLYMRGFIDGYAFDLQSWFRFFDLLERRDNVWRIAKRTAVYEKDRIEPVDPRGFPKDFFSHMDLSEFPVSAKFLCYVLKRRGRTLSTDIISVYSDKELALKEECEAWIEDV